MKKTAGILLAVMFMLLCGVKVNAQCVHKVYDMAEILSEEERDALEQKLTGISQKYGHDIAVCTVSSTGGTEIEDYSEKFCAEQNAGINGSGIVLVNSVGDRKYDIYAFGKMNDDIMIQTVRDRLRDDLKTMLAAGNYYGAYCSFADRCEAEIIYTSENGPNKAPSYAFPIAAVTGITVSLITVLIMKSGMKTTRHAYSAGNYVREGSFRLTSSLDIFLYSTVTRRARSNNSSSHGSGSHGGHSSGSY